MGNYIREPDTGAYVAQWVQGFPPDDIMDWLRGAGVAKAHKEKP